MQELRPSVQTTLGPHSPQPGLPRGAGPNLTAPPPPQYKSCPWEYAVARTPDCAADTFTGALLHTVISPWCALGLTPSS